MTGTATKDNVQKQRSRLLGDLIINIKLGMAYQEDRSKSVSYDEEYFKKTAGKTLKGPINKFRKKVVDSVVGDGKVLDFGCGDCAFIETRENTYGYDICPQTVDKLKKIGKFHDISNGFSGFDGITFFDSLEHLREPVDILKLIDRQYVIITVPIINDIIKIKSWKHYRPDEHYWYWTNNGFIDWMKGQDFLCEGYLEGEIEAGREDTPTYIFRKRTGPY